MYWTGESMKNLLSYCGLVKVRISASEKDLHVHKKLKPQIRNPKVCGENSHWEKVDEWRQKRQFLRPLSVKEQNVLF